MHIIHQTLNKGVKQTYLKIEIHPLLHHALAAVWHLWIAFVVFHVVTPEIEIQ